MNPTTHAIVAKALETTFILRKYCYSLYAKAAIQKHPHPVRDDYLNQSKYNYDVTTCTYTQGQGSPDFPLLNLTQSLCVSTSMLSSFSRVSIISGISDFCRGSVRGCLALLP